ncbi:sulfotransferase family protein [Rhodobacterales bacterium HKCCE3408]|nr:sulfotransferase family protein [Rhodobacterales bacterium HKCCE3408]
MSDYGLAARLMHRMVLGSRAVAETCFDIDQRLVPRSGVEQGRHVYIAGLARAGTTILMRRINETGDFRSLTYADMPFVLAPNLWKRLRGGAGRTGEFRERAHGDGIMVDAASPEALEEVFWRIFGGPDYIRSASLSPHAPDVELLDRYRAYVAAILHSGGRPRYLCKNNNNILRLPALRQAFPDAAILIPYREPVDQAASLLRQHERFTEAVSRDRFTGDYMRWLGHHEFGPDHRPFAMVRGTEGDPASLAYWLEQWVGVYGWLRETAPREAIWVRYEDLCDDLECWRELAARIDIAASGKIDFRRGGNADSRAQDLPHPLVERATSLYDALPRVGKAGVPTASRLAG